MVKILIIAERFVLNKSPIFINAFAQGGSNLLWNIFQTHPNVCSPIGETHEIFKPRGSGKWGKINNIVISLLSRQWNLFDVDNLSPRRNISKKVMRFIDQSLYKAKLATLNERYNRYKNEHEKYSLAEIKNSRLVSKNPNGIIFMTGILSQMYPDAVFVALIRNGLALCESYLRRERTSSAAEFGEVYNKISQKMIKDSKIIKNYYLLKFEDLVNKPRKTIKLLYQYAGLNLEDIEKIRLKVKTHFDKKGRRVSKYPSGQKIWLEFNELSDFLKPKINDYHISRLDDQDKNDFMKVAGKTMSYFSYQ